MTLGSGGDGGVVDGGRRAAGRQVPHHRDLMSALTDLRRGIDRSVSDGVWLTNGAARTIMQDYSARYSHAAWADPAACSSIPSPTEKPRGERG